MEPYWQLLVPRLTNLGLSPDRVSHHPSVERIRPGSNVMIREREPRLFLELFFASLLRGCNIWLASPDWRSQRLAELAAMLPGIHLLGDTSPLPDPLAGVEALDEPLQRVSEGQQVICVPTGGSSGRLKFAVHSWDTLAAAGNAFLEHFGQQGHRSLCVLPTYHVGGLMQAVRVLLSGGELQFGNPHDPRHGLPHDFRREGCFLSLVPTQLRRLLDDDGGDWLRSFEAILLGGAAADARLLADAREARLPLAPSYGMTETAAVIAALDPAAFLAGKTGVGRALPHVSLLVVPEGGSVINKESPGRVLLRSRSLCLGLLPGSPMSSHSGFLTNDLGYFDTEGILHIKGRADNVIVSGGQKLDPGEIEEVLLASGKVREVLVVGRPDPEWGQAAAAYWVAEGEGAMETDLAAIVRAQLSPAHVPKHWIRLDALPRNAMGKLDRSALPTGKAPDPDASAPSQS